MSKFHIVDSQKLDRDLRDIANTIRDENASADLLGFPNGFVEGINTIAEPFIEREHTKDDAIGSNTIPDLPMTVADAASGCSAQTNTNSVVLQFK